MHYRRSAALIVLVAALGATASFTTSAWAEDYSVGALQIAKPWMRATPKGASVAGGYMRITNRGTAPDRLVGGSTEAAARFEVHSMVMEQGVAKMRPVAGGLEIKPGETVDLRPGSFHIMLMGLKLPLEAGQKVKGALEFETAGKIEIEYQVESIGAASPASPKHGH